MTPFALTLALGTAAQLATTTLLPPAADVTHAKSVHANRVGGVDVSEPVTWIDGVRDDVGLPAGAASGEVTSVSAAGVAGTAVITPSTDVAFRKLGAQPLTALHGLAGSTGDVARAIDDAGDVVGTSASSAVLWLAGSLDPTLLQAGPADAFGVNDAGDACGDDATTGASVLWLAVTTTIGPAFPAATSLTGGGGITHARAVNDGDFVVGSVDDGSGGRTPAIWRPTFNNAVPPVLTGVVESALALPAGFVGGEALAIDARGDVAGFVVDPAGIERAVVWISPDDGRTQAVALLPGSPPSRAAGIFAAADGTLVVAADENGRAAELVLHPPTPAAIELSHHFALGETTTRFIAPALLNGVNDADGDLVTVVPSDGTVLTTLGGSVVTGADGIVDYTLPDAPPAPQFDDSTTVTLTDGFLTSTETVIIHVVQRAPVVVPAAAVSYHPTAASPSLSSSVRNVVNDPDGDVVSVINAGTVATTFGAATVNADGSFVYTPSVGSVGDDVLSVDVTDGVAVVPLSLTITLAESAPTVADDEADVTLIGGAKANVNVLLNDVDDDGDRLIAEPARIVTDHGSAIVSADGGVSWLGVSFTGDETFAVVVTDGWLQTTENVTLHGLKGAGEGEGEGGGGASGCACSTSDPAGTLCALAVLFVARRRRPEGDSREGDPRRA